MNTSELLVLIFAFLVGYMLYKRCGYRSVEGIKVHQLGGGTCNVDDNVWKYVDENKLKGLNGGLFLTPNQCFSLKKKSIYTGEVICNNLGLNYGPIFEKDVSKLETCKNVCPPDKYWGIDSAQCLDNPTSDI